jgi:hypothetical protein
MALTFNMLQAKIRPIQPKEGSGDRVLIARAQKETAGWWPAAT